jgi:hypothetical protein
VLSGDWYRCIISLAQQTNGCAVQWLLFQLKSWACVTDKEGIVPCNVTDN